jgi:carbohydrate diacid regulator
MNNNVPEISAPLRAWTEKISGERVRIIDRVFEMLTHVGPYDALDAATRLDLRESIAFSAELWFKTLLTGVEPTANDLSAFQEFGRRRIYQGVPLQSLLRAFRLGSRELWCACIEDVRDLDGLQQELLFKISPYLMEYFDEMAQLISQAYMEEQYKQARWRESLQHQLHSMVFNFPDDIEGFTKTTAALGLDATVPRIALAIDIEGIDVESVGFDSEIDRVVATIARRMRFSVDDVFECWHRDLLMLWVPCRRGDLMGMSDRDVALRVGAVMEVLPEIRAIGVGLMGEGAAGWAMSATESGRALSFGRGRQTEAKVRMYSDIVVEESVRGTKNALRYLVSLIEQLANEPELLTTLEMYFAQLQRRKSTASELGIHPNTLNYRLDRIESILGASLDDAGWVSKLDVALKLRASSR